MIDAYKLEQLAAFAKYGTLSKAAVVMHVSQPALSRSMQRLEEDLGVTLFERSKNRLALNENGLLAAEYAVRILALGDEMAERVRALDSGRHTLCFGADAPGPILHFTDALARRFPDKEIVSEQKERPALIADLKAGRYSFIVLFQPLKEKGLHCRRCLTERLLLSVRPSHPAARRESVSFADMDGASFLMFSQVGFWEGLVRRAMPQARFILQHDFADFEELVGASSLPSFASDLTLRLQKDESERVYVPFSDPEATAVFYLVCRAADSARIKKLTED
ncbi:LysR family transcriptional regulator [bacterium]|nr:LysR family transcriptional regulator [bacterium]